MRRYSQNEWHLSRKPVLNFAFSDSAWWVQWQVRNPGGSNRHMALELASAFPDYVDVYIEQANGEFRKTLTGDRRPVDTREIRHRYFVFSLHLPPRTERTVFLRLQAHDGLHRATPLTLWDYESFVQADLERNLFDGLILGVLFVMFFYNLLVGLSLRERAYWHFLLFVASGVLWFLTYSGFAPLLLWPNAPALANWSRPASICLTFLVHFPFMRSYLNMRESMPRLDFAAQICFVLWAGVLLFTVFGRHSHSFLVIIALISPTCLFFFLVCGVALYRGVRTARYYLLAFSLLIGGVAMVSIQTAGFLPTNVVTTNTVSIGYAASVVVFGLGLADSINVIRDEREAAQKLALAKEIEARQAEQRSADDLRRINALKDAFLANTSHELRTPLHGIIGLAESLSAGLHRYDEERIVAQLGLIARSGRRLAHLVNDILDFEKLRNDDITLHRRAVHLRTSADVVLALVAAGARTKGLELRNEVPDELPPVLADEARLEQILHNLVGNAVRYTDSGNVRVGAILKGEAIEVYVQDTGIGIAQSDQADIFETFHQLDDGARRGGTGLGLAISRRLVRLHGSDIEVESRAGTGSRFAFRLPVADNDSLAQASDRETYADIPTPIPVKADTAHPIEQTIRNSAATERTTVILLVDDEPVNLEVMQSTLELEGYTAVPTGSVAEARKYMSDNAAPDLVVLDIMMPHVSGLELARELRERHSLTALPILMVTARTQTDDLMAALESGANDYLTKPFEREEFLLRVRNLLSLATSRRTAARQERARIISDLHDHLGATLTDLHFLSKSAQDNPGVAEPFVARLQSMVGRAVGELRADLLGLEDLDLLEENLIGGLNMIVLRRYVEAGREVDFTAPEAGRGELQRRLGAGRTAALYSVIREIVTNDLKYGRGTATWSLSWSADAASMEGLRLDFRSLSFYRLERHGAGRGTAGIVRRLSEIGGTVQMSLAPVLTTAGLAGTAEEGPGRDIRITLRIPLKEG